MPKTIPLPATRGFLAILLLALISCGESGDNGSLSTPDPGPLLSIELIPADASVLKGETAQLRAVGHYASGHTRDITELVAWSSQDPIVADVDDHENKGELTGRCCGITSVQVQLGTIPGESRVTVESALQGASLLSPSSENGRYFVNEFGQHVYLTGSHTWLTLQDVGETLPPPAFGFDAYLDSLETWNHNFFRLWMSEHSRWMLNLPTDDIWSTPLPYARTGTELAIDGFPQFDLDQWDDEYFTRLRERTQEAEDRGLYVAVMLFQGWSIVKEKGRTGERNPWLGHPYHRDNNINGIDGDPNGDDSGAELQLLQIPEVTARQEAYVHKVIDTVNEFSNVIYEISNESEDEATPWQEHMVQVIRDYEATLPLQHPVGITVEWPDGNNEELLTGPADWISPTSSLTDPDLADGSKVILADTDHICGICGTREWVWKSFTSGENPIFMDLYDELANVLDPGDPYDPVWREVRLAMGFTRTLASRLDLAVTEPHPELSSTGYCLANEGSKYASYVVYSPAGTPFEVDMSASSGSFTVEWLSPDTGEYTLDGRVEAGQSRVFSPPFSGDAVLILQRLVPRDLKRAFVPYDASQGDPDESPGAELSGD